VRAVQQRIRPCTWEKRQQKTTWQRPTNDEFNAHGPVKFLGALLWKLELTASQLLP